MSTACLMPFFLLPDNSIQVLLVLNFRNSSPHWKFPGGGIQASDATPLAAAVREAREETRFPFDLESVESSRFLKELEARMRKSNPYSLSKQYFFGCVIETTQAKLSSFVTPRRIFDGDASLIAKAFPLEEVASVIDTWGCLETYLRGTYGFLGAHVEYFKAYTKYLQDSVGHR